jgi:4-hydroxythreonine-4-phosphate dehydrogenase
VKLIKAGKADALVTAPINKKAASLAGFKFPGHTEYLAYLVGARKFCMMLVACPPKPIPNPTQELRRGGGPLRVVLATRHIALKDVSRCLDQNQIRDAIILTHQALKKYFRIRHPRIAVCALNPHAGEDGMFSDEESRIITPAIKKAKVKGVVGPLPADSLFYDAYRGRFDAQIVMYHDQGLIPLKMVAKDAAVNITLGLPFIRTSPAHGTAFDIAGRNKANPSSMIEAIKLACQLVRR